MGNSFKHPLVPLINQPVNIDTPIQEMQVALANALPWLTRSFGRSWQSFANDSGRKPSTYPEVWQGAGQDLLNVMPNDNLDAQSFFKVEEPINILDYQWNGFSRMGATVSIIFWFNLLAIDPELNFRFVELLKGQVQRAITEAPISSGTWAIQRVWETAENVFRGYTLDLANDQTLVHPYGGFRFECSLNYLENCPDVFYSKFGTNPPLIYSQQYSNKYQ